ncbi:MAG: primosomal protein N' [Desulfosalsimonadaceae bacterium]
MKQDYAYIEVAVPLPVHASYTYAVPEALNALVAPGKRVLAEFGSRKVSCYVLGPAEPADTSEIKYIEDVLDHQPLFPAEIVPFFQWISDYYFHPLGEVIAEALPSGININEFVTYALTEAGRQAIAENRPTSGELEIISLMESHSMHHRELERKLGLNIARAEIQRLEKKGWVERQREIRGGRTRPKTERHAVCKSPHPPADTLSAPKQAIVEYLQSAGEVPVRRLREVAKNASRHLKDLQGKGFIQVLEKPVYRDPFGDTVAPDTPPALTSEQQRVLTEISRCLGSGFSAHLLAGVTGSGKTEVYMRAAAAAIALGHTVLVLVPEIALISQMERRFRARFGDCIAVLHSGLSTGERYDQWMRIASREAPVAIGARSAIFAPLANTGLIIVDEEHDSSYKQESRCRYNARDLAVVRARQTGGVVVLGSATPSVQSVHNVAVGKFRELNLRHRVYHQPPPEISVIDLREHEGTRGIRRLITTPLINAVKKTLARGEQVLLFLNRRGFASYPVCASCGEALKCKNCDITLTLHKSINGYKCHLCGHTRPATAKCDNCGAKSIKQLGLGTEKIEEAINNFFPEARVARMDRDTTRRRGALVNILKSLRNGEIDILVGTQMIAKGHDFPNITLVGIICADLSLNFPDYRAGETTFQVLAQVAGRAGRGTRPGKVLLQSYNPDHFSITAARSQDFMAFYKQEIKLRQSFHYPPFARMIQLRISGKNQEKTRQQAEATGELCRRLKKEQPQWQQALEVFGPIEAPLSRIAGRYRWQILLKSSRVQPLHRFTHALLFENRALACGKGVQITVDVDPILMM